MDWIMRQCILVSGLLLAHLNNNGVTCHVEPLTSYPPDLESLFYTARMRGDLTKQTGETVFWSCLQIYVSKFADQYSKTIANMTSTQRQFLMNSLVTIRARLERVGSKRFKRQSLRSVLRREIRMLTERERADYFRAINSIKMDPRLPPNIYDFMANFHNGPNVITAHMGPGFPGWHRVYLYMYEFFLQLHIPWVSLPYWASVLDNVMSNPRDSVIWSPRFMGPGVGRPGPGSGPFSNWTQIDPETVFERNYGFGPLYTWRNIRQILRRRRNIQILLPTAEIGADFEGIHSGPHMFVGGSMARLNTAARDPIFFMHHAFVDLLWQEFRNQQIQRRINPATDYPFNATDRRFRAQHAPNATMGFFRENIFEIRFLQMHGYSRFFDRYIRYAPIPRCSRRRPNCGSPYLFCRTFGRGRPRCVGRTTRDVEGLVDPAPQQSPETSGERSRSTQAFSIETPPKSDVVEPIDPVISALDIPLNPPGLRTRRSPIGPQPTPQIASYTCPAPQVVNDFNLRENSNGIKTTPSDWVKISAKIIIKRPPQFQDFSDYSLYGYTPNGGESIGDKKNFMDEGKQHYYSECINRLQTVGTIKVVSYGLNYDGSAEEIALSDNRLGISDTNTFIPVKRPSPGKPSEAIVAAFDACGRACKSYFFKNIQGRFVADDMIGGGIRVTTDRPLQYGESFPEATLSSWRINSPTSCPIYDQTNAPITFYCDYSADWFWPVGSGQETILSTEPRLDVPPSIPTNVTITGGTSQNRKKSRIKSGRKSRVSVTRTQSKSGFKPSSTRVKAPNSPFYPRLKGDRLSTLRDSTVWRYPLTERPRSHSRWEPEIGCELNSFCTIAEPCGPCQPRRAYRCTDRRYRAACRGQSGAFIVYMLDDAVSEFLTF